ncbi:2-oxo-4-hydroxy-4-carboxy-5-ureidoimidazoline decarboxylase [Deinococcus peraridilitoris]|uniref:2-oxo-4-hydroxy-4-carboxy-5-ureidoimidazoline decarboxylase n=1 Tax=Deinococcus peraridilitoris (strain DSM 19664 / LMG 22246 / CIP 109416 / KR-200) TaxID=937777 RepID=K9ZXQ8_DEIPD|nr:2-oxo-4-hydroxy-4-carboxy-5-ureidoimidazoline decarboxylase [Deinococcus peraridilitoris]AFZ65687.1 OHCU decarboxylase [Deinococcus peraridilitoris DSM 19664]
MQLPDLNALDRAEFVAYFGRVLEHSPRYAERVWQARPFHRLESLQDAFKEAIVQSDPGEQLALIRAHPDLAGKVALAGQLTAESSREQSSVGLDRLTPEEYARFERVNTAYHEKFAMPFVICVREHTKESILDAAERRLHHLPHEEIAEALVEISKIAGLRLADLVQATAEVTVGRKV